MQTRRNFITSTIGTAASLMIASSVADAMAQEARITTAQNARP